MDLGNPLRGPRRAARRGEEALRYGRREGAVSASVSDSATATPPSLPFPPGASDAYRNQFDDSDSADDGDINDVDDGGDDDDDNNNNNNGQAGSGLMAHLARIRATQSAVEATQGQHGDEYYEYEGVTGEDESMDEAEDTHSADDEFEFASRGVEEEDEDEDEDEEGEEEEEDNLHPGEDVDVDGEEVDVDDTDGVISFDPMLLGLKEINNLAHFSVSSHKPGNGVDELLHDDLNKYWQSDGPQPHLLTIHFLRRVEIRAIRFYVDYNQDESYTPTSVVLSAGTGHHDLLEFAAMALTTPVGWQEIDLSQVGGGADGQSLCCWIVQVRVKENHQNGKDTHIRGIKLYAIDENAPPADSALDELARIKTRTLQLQHNLATAGGSGMEAVDKEDYLFERLITQPPDKLPGAPERSGSMATFLRDEEIR
jgi:hypothetical protein